MITVVLLGAGNVASHLYVALKDAKEAKIVQVYNRSQNGLKTFKGEVSTTTDLTELKPADCYIITIPDDAIASLSASLPFASRLVVHTSGSVAMDELNTGNRRGVFYPLQTFSKNRELSFPEIPLCVEAENPEDLQLLESLGSCLKGKSYRIDSEQRKKIHIAAVFVCNFVNHLYQIGYELTSGNDIPFDILIPLIKETAEKIETAVPEEVQTGPAKRNDLKTMEKHLKSLHLPEHREIYKVLSDAIMETHGRKKL